MKKREKSDSLLPLAMIIFLAVIIPLLMFFVSAQRREKVSGADASWTENYESLTELAVNSDVVILGELMNSSVELRQNVVFTMQEISVVDVISGDLEVGDTVFVLQTGGSSGEYSTLPPDEIPLLSEGQEYLMFLSETEYDDTYGSYYLISGGYQGCAAVVNGEIHALSSTDQNDVTILLDDSFLLDEVVTIVEQEASVS